MLFQIDHVRIQFYFLNNVSLIVVYILLTKFSIMRSVNGNQLKFRESFQYQHQK